MAESQNSIDIELEKLTLEDTGVSNPIGSPIPEADEDLELLNQFSATDKQLASLYTKLASLSNLFVRCIRRLNHLLEKATLIPTGTLDKLSLEQIRETAHTFYTNEQDPFSRYLIDAYPTFHEKISNLKKANLDVDVVKDELSKIQQVLSDGTKIAVDYELRVSKVDQYLCEIGHGFFSPEFLTLEQGLPH